MPKCFYKFSLSLPLLFLYCISWSQEFIYKHYDLQDGLPNPTIHAIFQDNDGFLWLGTESGLCRYDGNRFKTYTVKDGLPGNEVLGMFQDSKGRIWMQFYKSSIAYIYKGKIYNQQNDTLLKKIVLLYRIYGIAEDAEGNIGICDPYHLVTISPQNKIKKINFANIIKTDFTYQGKLRWALALCTDRNGKFLVNTSNSVYRIENDSAEFLKKFDVRGTGGFGTAGVLLHKNYAANIYTDSIFLEDTTVPFKINALRTIKFSPVGDSVFSINYFDGCELFYLHNYRVVNILPGKKVSNVYMDSEKNIWIGTLGSGLYKMSSQEILNRKIKNTDNDIGYIIREKDKILVGNSNTEVYAFDGDDFVPRDLIRKSVLPKQKILHYERLAGDKTLLIIPAAASVLERGKIVESIHTNMLKEVSKFDNDHLMLAMHRGLFIIRKKDLRITDTIWERKSLSALHTSDSFLIGTTAGLYVIEKKNGKYLLADSLLTEANIINIKKTTDNLIWVCTVENGLYCISSGKIIHHFAEDTGLPSNNGRTLYVRGGEIWFGTDKGLVKINRANGQFYIKRYSTADGLPSDIINCVFVSDETTYVGTTEGVCLFNEKMMQPPSICNLRLTGVKIGNNEVDVSDSYQLSSNHQFTIEFSGISLRSERETVYRYRIQGLDDTWRRTNLASLEFTSLPGGDYELEIIAINKFGKESLPLKIALHVKKPFHKTTVFRVLVIGLPLALILYAYNRRVYATRKRQMQKLQQQVKVIKLEQMALRAQMNPHFIFNCINAIQQLVTEKDIANTNKFITSFSDLVRQTLDNAPELYIRLTEEIKFLTNYFELERIRLEDRFSYKIDASSINNLDQWMVPNMVIQPFAENAIKHGVRYKKNGLGFIEVRFEQHEALLKCTIIDNGIGRERAGQMRKESGILHEPRGVGITLKRVESLNALTPGMVSVSIEDLVDENQQVAGTKVTIVFHKITDQYDKDSYN